MPLKRVTPILCLLCGGAAAQDRCAGLTSLAIPDIRIISATEIPPGPFAIRPEDSPSFTAPEFCRVIAVATPTPDSKINLEVWLPPSHVWNGNFEGVGNGAYIGAISYGAMANAINRLFATASTDTGHSGSDLSFGAQHPERIADWGYRAIHVMTDVAKIVIRSYYGRFPAHSFFNGCSTGGSQALSEAQRFPSDYDGIIAGDPGNNRIRLNVGFLWAWIATHQDPASNLSDSKLSTLHRAVIAACDKLDGVADGIIGDPRKCKFDPATMACKGADNDSCLTKAQVDAVRKIYEGPRNPRTGERWIAGYSPGSENPTGDPNQGWQEYITGPNEPMRLDFWKYWVFNDPNWDWRTFDFDRDVTYAEAKVASVNATSTDLRAFQESGGKLLLYSGWADPIGPPEDAIDYYEGVARRMGGSTKIDSFFRLYMVPGMAHCNGGPGPVIVGGARAGDSPGMVPPQTNTSAEYDVLSAMELWVETAAAPGRIIASHFNNEKVDRTRPVCPYPQVARWNGTGSIDLAESFVCVAPDKSDVR